MNSSPRPRRRLVALLAAVCGATWIVACTSEDPKPAPPVSSARPTPSADACPARFAEPDPDRPRITLRFGVDASRKVVTGTETVVFTPDLPIRELVFRLWPNQPTAPKGTRLTVTSVKDRAFTVESSGTLLRIPLGREVPAGESVTATLDFTLTLGGAIFERWGTTGRTAWWGTGHPLLAWERGAGWQTQPATRAPGEYAVSEVARYDVTVDAPATDTVHITGTADAPVPSGPGRRRWHAMNLTARDISVAVGSFVRRDGVADGVPIVVAVSADTAASASVVLEHVARSVRQLVDLLGPFPYPNLTVVALPSFGGRGIEYPGGFFLGPTLNPSTITHEAAHEWFYGLVGDNQARDPWLDEAFATYAEAVASGRINAYEGALARPDRVDSGTGAFADRPNAYFQVVYGKGAGALLAARREAGAPAFDAAVRCYINANAWRVVTPDDVADAFAGLPKARDALRSAGALR
jgi:hypothetical protein